EKLNFRVRDGNGCFLLAIIAGPYELVSSFLQNWITSLASTECLFRLSPRAISIRQLRTSPCFHPGPIDLVIYEGSYYLRAMGNLILRGASRLDAFSAYPVRTWLPSDAPGGTTGTPAVRPSRSSRTKDSSSQISCARDG